MDYKISVSRPWRYRHPRFGSQVLDPGVYSVPEQLSDALAQVAIGDGFASRVGGAEAGPAVPQEAVPQRPSRRRKAKGPAPENRAFARAPENKQAV